MNKLLKFNQIETAATEYKNQKHKIVLAGGCFDILHSGHLKFLRELRKHGRVFLLLESDESITHRKGLDRPINSLKTRALMLSALKNVDYIIPLKGMTKNEEYDKLIVQIKPDIIGITKGDKFIKARQKQCEMYSAKLLIVDKFKSPSTTDLIAKI